MSLIIIRASVATIQALHFLIWLPWFDHRGAYSYFWWTNGVLNGTGRRPWPHAPEGAYAFHGGARNLGYVIPEWDMVIVRLSPPDTTKFPNPEDPFLDGFFDILSDGISEVSVVMPSAPSGLAVR